MSGHAFLDTNRREVLNPGLRQDIFSQGGLPGTDRSRGGSNDTADAFWAAANRLTVSIAPDGTDIGGYSSSLFRAFRELADESAMRQLVADGMQSWTDSVNLNLGLMDDTGAPFGTPGLSQGDTRFGDIRIGAIPLSGDVFAVATSLDQTVSGTWAGDILFNTEAKFASVDQFYSVFIHELGHSLGLIHSDNANDVMNASQFNLVQSSNDVAELQTLYGARALDQYDEHDPNDTLQSAVRLKNPGSFSGTVPLIAYGDIDVATDQDYFELRPLDPYPGTVTFRVLSREISLLAPRLAIFREDGTAIDIRSSVSWFGDELAITVDAIAEESLFVRVDASGLVGRTRGSYALVATFDDNVLATEDQINAVLKANYAALDQEDIHTLFTEPAPLFNDDLHTNDTAATATPLDEVAGTTGLGRFRVQAGISDDIDVDYYSFSTPASNGTPSTLEVGLVALEQNGLVGTLAVLDDQFREVPHRVTARGNGRYQIEIDGIQAEAEYRVRVAADRPGKGFHTGNYTLDIGMARQSTPLTVFGEGELNPGVPQSLHTMYVAQTQMFHLGVESTRDVTLANSHVWVSLFDVEGATVWRGLTRPGELRTANSVVLRPGTYSVQVDLVTDGLPISTSTKAELRYRIVGRSVTDPMGPEIVNPATMPFPHCTPTSPEFCYPGDRQSTDPFILVNTGEVPPPPGVSDPPPLEDINNWFWYENWQLGTP